MKFREATPDDAPAIAALHADSWRRSYRGMLSDHFLDVEVVGERTAVWQNRLNTPNPDQWVLLAENETGLLGFVCLFGNADPTWGTLLDNLHIQPAAQGQGIGKRLMKKSFRWTQKSYPDHGLFLWVFAQNERAMRFYERLGGQRAGEKMETSFGTQPVRAIRVAWESHHFGYPKVC